VVVFERLVFHILTAVVCTDFVDELPELDEIYSANPKAKITTVSDNAPPQGRPSPAASVAVASITSEDLTYATSWTPRSLYSGTQVPPRTKRRRTNESDNTSFDSVGQSPGVLSYHKKAQSFERTSPATFVRREDAIDSLLRAADYSEQGVIQTAILLSSPSQSQVQVQPFPEVQPDTPGVWPHASVQEACLMRYFIDELACWVCLGQICHIQRHLLTI
jgi:hypothetical protein